jgi:serine/threonine-protein kinase
MSESPSNANPRLIGGRYREIRKIGSGGMSVVILAEDTVLQRTVALKMLADHLAGDEDFVTRFRHEALAVAQLQHQNIVQVYDSGHDPESHQHFIVMEYIEGTPLSEMLRGGRKLETDRAVAIASDACAALACAHRAGVIHRDVKPANLIITNDGVAKLADFGIAKASQMTRVTQVGSVLGTVAYLSPEQAIGGETGPQSDIYSLAVVTFEMLGGRQPYLYKSITELAMKQRDELPTPLTALNPEVPVELDRTIRVALSYDQRLRFATANEFAAALAQGARREESEFVTKVLADPAAATRLLARRGRPADARTHPADQATAVTQIARPPAHTTGSTAVAHPPASQKTNRRLAIAALLIAAVIAAAVVGVLFSASSPQPVRQDTLQTQVEGMRNFVDQNR